MPELPEVETMRRGILAAEGCVIEDVHKLSTPHKSILVQPGMAVLRRTVRGQMVTAVERIGKRVVLRLGNEQRLVFEPRMTGLVLVEEPPDLEHLRFQVDLSGGSLRRLWYWDRRGLGSVQLYSPAQFARRVEAKLGPDALNLSSDELRRRLAGTRRAIKVALLDQRAVSGIGNLYASEILNVARLRPTRRCHLLTADDWRRLHAALLSVLREAIRYEGSTLSDGTYRNALNHAGSYQNQHRVYDRAGLLCGTCGQGTVKRMVQAQRSTFFCPVCQRSGR